MLKKFAPLFLAFLLLLPFVSAASEGFDETVWGVSTNAEGFVEGFEFDPAASGVTDFTVDPRFVGCWLLYSSGDESGATTDRCGASQDLTVTGTPTYAQSGPAGTASGQDAVAVSGSGEYFEAADGSDEFDTATYAIGGWFNLGNNVTKVAVRKGSNELNIQHNTGGFMRGHNNSSADEEQSAGGTIVVGTWVHLVLRYVSGTAQVEIFADAQDACVGGCVASTDRDNDAGALGILDAPGGLASWQGDAMEIFYADANVTDTEICEIMLCGLDGTADGAARDAAFGASGCQCSDIDTCC